MYWNGMDFFSEKNLITIKIKVGTFVYKLSLQTENQTMFGYSCYIFNEQHQALAQKWYVHSMS